MIVVPDTEHSVVDTFPVVVDQQMEEDHPAVHFQLHYHIERALGHSRLSQNYKAAS